MTDEPLDELESLGVVIGWARTMRHTAVWFPDDGVVLLNASCPRQRVLDGVRRLMPMVRRDAPMCDVDGRA